MKVKRAILLAAITAAIVLSGRTASAYGPTDLIHLHPNDSTRPPIGWVQFCQSYPEECKNSARDARPMVLTPKKLRELERVNKYFNHTIEPVTDQEQYGVVERWTYAETGKGDCEDYVLEKRRRLIELGWPQQALLITVVINKISEGHAVLTIATDGADYVLDNLTDEVLLWSRTGLTFIKRQSAHDPNRWIDLGRLIGRPEAVTAATRR